MGERLASRGGSWGKSWGYVGERGGTWGVRGRYVRSKLSKWVISIRKMEDYAIGRVWACLGMFKFFLKNW